MKQNLAFTIVFWWSVIVIPIGAIVYIAKEIITGFATEV
jgi:hypothetical protein